MCLIARFLLFAVLSFIIGLLFALTCRRCGIVIIILRLRLVIVAIIVIIVALLIRLCLTLLFTTR